MRPTAGAGQLPGSASLNSRPCGDGRPGCPGFFPTLRRGAGRRFFDVHCVKVGEVERSGSKQSKECFLGDRTHSLPDEVTSFRNYKWRHKQLFCRLIQVLRTDVMGWVSCIKRCDDWACVKHDHGVVRLA